MEGLSDKLDGNQIKYLQKYIYPQLGTAVDQLIDHLIKTKEAEKYIQQKRVRYFQNLYIKQENQKNKGKEELGSDYNEDSDDEYRKFETVVEEFEDNNKRFFYELDQSKEDTYVRQQLHDLSKKRKQLKESLLNPNQSPKNKIIEQIKQQERKASSETVSEGSEFDEEDETNQNEESQEIHKQTWLNPLEFLAQQLRNVRLERDRIAQEKYEQEQLIIRKQLEEEEKQRQIEYQRQQLQMEASYKSKSSARSLKKQMKRQENQSSSSSLQAQNSKFSENTNNNNNQSHNNSIQQQYQQDQDKIIIEEDKTTKNINSEAVF